MTLFIIIRGLYEHNIRRWWSIHNSCVPTKFSLDKVTCSSKRPSVKEAGKYNMLFFSYVILTNYLYPSISIPSPIQPFENNQ